MEMIRINSMKLKIILTSSDMEKLNISNDTLDYNTTETKRAFWDILDRAKRETGFDVENNKLYVQIFPSNDGGCEMFVTKHQIAKKETYAYRTSQSNYKDYLKEKLSCKKQILCEADDLEDIISLCIRLDKNHFQGNSRLYLTNNNKYILFLDTERKYPSFIQDNCIITIDNYPFIGEYGKLYETDRKKISYLNEYAKTICEKNAVNLFSHTFKKQ